MTTRTQIIDFFIYFFFILAVVFIHLSWEQVGGRVHPEYIIYGFLLDYICSQRLMSVKPVQSVLLAQCQLAYPPFITFLALTAALRVLVNVW